MPTLLIATSALIVGALGSVHLVLTFWGSKLMPRDESVRAAMEGCSPVIPRIAGFVILLAACFAGAGEAAEGSTDTARLQMFIGRWTTQGDEESFVEVCDWYHGEHHVVCHSERARPDGSTGHGMSILSHVPDRGYVYTGIGSRGRYETLEGGAWSDGVLTFTSAHSEGGKEVVTRIQIGPETEQGFPFVVDTSTDGGAWIRVETTTYVRRP